MIKKILCKIFFFNFFKYQINKIKINQSINLSENLDNKNLQNINELCEKYIDKKFVKEHVFSKFECKKYKHRFLEIL